MCTNQYMLDKMFGIVNEVLPLAVGPGSGPGGSVGAGTLFTDYVAGVAAYSFVIGVLVTVLLAGALLILNLGLLSKRSEDRIGGRTPSDLGILKQSVWPEEPFQLSILPAEEEDYQESKVNTKNADLQ